MNHSTNILPVDYEKHLFDVSLMVRPSLRAGHFRLYPTSDTRQ
jgi:hypothetical protein